MPKMKTRSRSRSNDPLINFKIKKDAFAQPQNRNPKTKVDHAGLSQLPAKQNNPKITVEPTSPKHLLGNANYRSRNSLNQSHNNKEKKSKSPGNVVPPPSKLSGHRP